MTTRRQILQRVWQQVSGAIPSDDNTFTEDLLNRWLNDAIGVAVQLNYVSSIKLDGIAYINNSFASTFSGLPINQTDIFTYQVELPQIPFALGHNEGLQSLKIQAASNSGGTGKSFDCVPMTLNQVGINNGRRKIFGKYEYWSEGPYAYIITSGQDLSIGFTAIARLISGGDSGNLDSILNIPDDYFAPIVAYMQKQLGLELATPQDLSNNGTQDRTP